MTDDPVHHLCQLNLEIKCCCKSLHWMCQSPIWTCQSFHWMYQSPIWTCQRFHRICQTILCQMWVCCPSQVCRRMFSAYLQRRCCFVVRGQRVTGCQTFHCRTPLC